MAVQRHEVSSYDGTRIPLWTSGSGKPLLIVHGAATDHGTWEAVRKYLEPHAMVAVMDRRATFGDPLGALTMQSEFEDVAAVANWLGVDTALVGHSSGALCTLGASLLLPKLSRLVLYEPPLEQGPHYPDALHRLNELLRANDIDGVFDAWLKQYVGMPESVAEQIKVSPLGVGIRSFARYLPREMASHLAHSFDARAFTKVTAATVYLLGSETPKDSVQLCGFIRLLEGTMPNFRVRELPGQGHFANVLAPELLAKAILDAVGLA